MLGKIIWDANPTLVKFEVPNNGTIRGIYFVLVAIAFGIGIFSMYKNYQKFINEEKKKKHPQKYEWDMPLLFLGIGVLMAVVIYRMAFVKGEMEIRWYGFLWAVGFALGLWVMGKIYKKEKMPESSIEWLLFFMLAFTVVGARLGHCLFYEPDFYLSNPTKMIDVFDGGLASHGGAIGILIGLWLYVRLFNNKITKEKGENTHITYLWILDRIVVPVCLVGALIRIGNVMNHEIYGTPTSLPWGFVFLRGQEQFCGTVDNYTACTTGNCCPQSEWLPCHPTGLYEAFFCLVAMGILLWMYYKRDLGHKQPGLMFGTFLIIIFGSRIAIEFLKNVQVDFERNMTFDMGQWLSVPFVVIGIVMIVWSFMHRRKLEG